jgi:ABC-type sugar transport system permease subunit
VYPGEAAQLPLSLNNGGLDMNRSKRTAPYVFIAPYFLLFFAFSVLPIVYTLYISFNNWNGFSGITPAGLGNYKRMLENGEFLLALKNTVIIMLYLIPLQLVIGIALAYMLHSKLVKFKEFFKTAIFAPYFTIPIASGLLWAFLFDGTSGTINNILQLFHIIGAPVEWIGNPALSKVTIAIIMLWRYVGYTVIFFLAGFVSIPEELYEAARVDGARAWHFFWKISLPMIKPIMIYMVVTSMIGGFQTFDEPNIIYTQGNYLFGPYSGGPEGTALTMVMLMGKGAFQNMQYGYGAAVAYGMFLVIAVFSFISIRLMTGRDHSDARY